RTVLLGGGVRNGGTAEGGGDPLDVPQVLVGQGHPVQRRQRLPAGAGTHAGVVGRIGVGQGTVGGDGDETAQPGVLLLDALQEVADRLPGREVPAGNQVAQVDGGERADRGAGGIVG